MNAKSSWMSEEEVANPETGTPQKRPFRKRLMHTLRRGHLYFGLFLFPWAVLYGITAFLFNHPTAFSDQATQTIPANEFKGTALESRPNPQMQAEIVVAKLNELQTPTTPYRLSGEAKYSGREFAFATVKAKDQTVSILVDLKNSGGTIRSAPLVERPTPEKAPFAVGGEKNKENTPRPKSGSKNDGENSTLKMPNLVADRIKESIPELLQKSDFPTGEITVTSVPDISFPMECDGRIWHVTYNSLTGNLNGVLLEQKPQTELSTRRFFTGLHKLHGFPGETNFKWFWALIVDAMAFTMCFWGITGLLMWWQIKATRKLGFVILLLSAVAATLLGLGMHSTMTS